jgi:hypothetical protein
MSITVISPTYLVGKGGAVSCGTVTCPVTDWNGDDACGVFDATNSGSGGNADPEATIQSMNGSYNCVWPVTAGEPAMQSGKIYAHILTAQTGSTYTFNALVTSVKVNTDIKGGVTYAVTYMSKGAITRAAA